MLRRDAIWKTRITTRTTTRTITITITKTTTRITTKIITKITTKTSFKLLDVSEGAVSFNQQKTLLFCRIKETKKGRKWAFGFAIDFFLLYNIMKCKLEEYAMNIIGEIGSFIIKYQDEILTGLIVLACGAVIFMIGKAFSNSRKKRQLLLQINETVSEINASVKSMGEKRTEVIYIDGRGSSGTRSVNTDAVQTMMNMSEEVLDADSAPEGKADPEKKKEEPEQAAPTYKYFSRDCAVSKDGKKYTEEELEAQIRE